MATKLMDAVAFLSLDNSKFKKSAKDSETQMQRLGQTVRRVGTTVATGLSGGYLLNQMNNWTKLGDSIEEASQRTGVGVESMSRLAYAANLSGSSLQGVEKSIRIMLKSMAAPSTQFEGALMRIGLSAQALRAMAPEQQFMSIMEGLAGVADEGERAGLALQLFGRGGAEMLPLLAEGWEGLVDTMRDAQAVGAVFTPEQAAQAAAYQDAIMNISTSLTNLIGVVGQATPLIDLLTEGMNTVAGLTTEVSQALSGTNEAGDVGLGAVLGEMGLWEQADPNAGADTEKAARRRWKKAQATGGGAFGPNVAGLPANLTRGAYRGAKNAALTADDIDSIPSAPTTVVVANANFTAGPDMKRAVNRSKSNRAAIQ